MVNNKLWPKYKKGCLYSRYAALIKGRLRGGKKLAPAQAQGPTAFASSETNRGVPGNYPIYAVPRLRHFPEAPRPRITAPFVLFRHNGMQGCQYSRLTAFLLNP